MGIKANNIKVYVVNLAVDSDKRERMQSLCEELSLNYEIINAVDGRSLSEDYISEVSSLDEALKYPLLRRPLAKGEIGCALSHVSLYKRIVDENIQAALILEDDVDISCDINLILDEICRFPKGWQCVLLGHHTPNSRAIETKSSFFLGKRIRGTRYKLRRPVELACGTYGYLISKSGASRLLGEIKKISKPIDHYTGGRNHINVFVCKPAAVKISEIYKNNSTIVPERLVLEKAYKKYSENEY